VKNLLTPALRLRRARDVDHGRGFVRAYGGLVRCTRELAIRLALGANERRLGARSSDARSRLRYAIHHGRTRRAPARPARHGHGSHDRSPDGVVLREFSRPEVGRMTCRIQRA